MILWTMWLLLKVNLIHSAMGHILQAPGIVGVRGIGNTYDGKYYVKNVTHKISRGRYTQQFTLTRSGVGSLSNTVRP